MWYYIYNKITLSLILRSSSSVKFAFRDRNTLYLYFHSHRICLCLTTDMNDYKMNATISSSPSNNKTTLEVQEHLLDASGSEPSTRLASMSIPIFKLSQRVFTIKNLEIKVYGNWMWLFSL